jgi:molecular chaperone Hsp33
MADHLVRAVAAGGRIRVVAADTTKTVDELCRIHEPMPPTAAAIGRLATGALLLAASLEKITRREPVLTIEIDGGGPAGRILATASPAGWVRAMVANPRANAEPVVNGKLNVAGVVGTVGDLTVTRDLGFGEPYRGVIPIQSGEIGKDVAHYLHDSEQIPAAVVLGVFVQSDGTVGASGGLMIQLLPGVSDAEAEELTKRVREFGAVTSHLIVGEAPESWIHALFPGAARILETNPVGFVCGCSMDKVETALKLLGAGEIQAVLDESHQRPTLFTCGFCRAEYRVDPERLVGLLEEIMEETLQTPVN